MPAARFISVTEKSLGIPAIRDHPLTRCRAMLLYFGGFQPLFVSTLCQARLFHLHEN
jgi:hypothetical protein